MDQTLRDYEVITIGTKESLSQNRQGSFLKATTVDSNIIVVVQHNITTTVHKLGFRETYPGSIQFNVNHSHWFR